MARQRKKKGDPVHGWLNLFKPVDMTSTQAVAICKRMLNAQKVGHGGTLDPLADGILPLAFGEATKTVAFTMEADKEYVFTVEWGKATASYDAEGVVIATSDVRPDRTAIEATLSRFKGEIEQVPPKFSAIKVDGERAYDLARDGEEFELEARAVTVHEAELVDMPDADHAVFRVCSGKGFYVRAMARDIAHALGTEGYITQLRRTRVGDFTEADAVTLDELTALSEAGDVPGLMDQLDPLEAPLGFLPFVEIDREGARHLGQGRTIVLLPHVVEHFRAHRAAGAIGELDLSRLAVAVHGGAAIAMGEVRAGRFQPVRVFQV